MKKFILSLLLFSFIVVTLYASLSYYVKPKNTVSNDFMASIADKHKRIDNLNCPKILFVGGSNLAFGLNSEEIEKAYAVPVVNLGLHAGLGLTFMMKELRSSLHDSDVVFLSLEYLLNPEGNYLLKKHTSISYSKAQEFYSYDLREELLSEIDITRTRLKDINLKRSSNQKQSNDVYVFSREAFNKYGDVTAHIGKKTLINVNQRFVLKYSYWSGIDVLNNFYAFAKSKNVKVYFFYPCLAESEFKMNQQVINRYANDLAGNLNIEILNKPTDLVYPVSLFYDTYYHLNGEGRELRTKKLIDLINHSPNALKSLSQVKRAI